MALQISEDLRKNICDHFNKMMNDFPEKRIQINEYLTGKTELFSLCMMAIYGHLHVNDLISVTPELIALYVEAELYLYETKEIDYTKNIPADVFFGYVLPPRVNNEWLDGSREYLQKELTQLIKEDDIRETVLNVNLWCFGKATYMPSDDRTLAPFGIMNSTVGRCGEESVFTVNALRSVGIPARQVYVPRWSHCDDNHAWVEVWINGSWHYLGACEPAEQLDQGWFTAAASKAMLVFTKRWFSCGREKGFDVENGLTLIANTGMYAPTKKVSVCVISNGVALQGATVSFQIINYSELYSLYETETDQDGKAEFSFGYGDLFISICEKDRFLFKIIDLRKESEVLIDWAEAKILYEYTEELFSIDLVPPLEKIPEEAKPNSRQFRDALALQNSKRIKRLQNFFCTDKSDPFEKYIKLARGNRRILAEFLCNPFWTETDKILLLDTLREKDFVDLQSGVLQDSLENALPYKKDYEEKIYQDYILAPRVGDETLLPIREKLLGMIHECFHSGEEVLSWINKEFEILPDRGNTHYYPSMAECAKNRIIPKSAIDLFFVSVCRTFGIPARLDQQTGDAEWLQNTGKWSSIVSENNQKVELTLRNASKQELNYREHFSLAVLRNGKFRTIQLPDLVLDNEVTLKVPAGVYRIISSIRQIDGTVSAYLFFTVLDRAKTVTLKIPEDQTEKKLKSISLYETGNTKIRNLLSLNYGREAILIFAAPGEEPTEHLLQEILACREEFSNRNAAIYIFLSSPDQMENQTLCRVCEQIPTVKASVITGVSTHSVLRKVMGVGDSRLPFVQIVDGEGKGVYASANYNIREAQRILNIIDILRKRDRSDKTRGKNHMLHTPDVPMPGIPIHPPVYFAPRAREPLILDGNLEKKFWKDIPFTDAFVDISGPDYPRPRFQTRAKICWDEENLYIGARLDGDEIWANIQKRDSVMYYDNDFEVFIDPSSSTHNYMELEMNALNTQWDLMLTHPYRDGGRSVTGWDMKGLETAVFVDGRINDPTADNRFWSVEIRIPFKGLMETYSKEENPPDLERCYPCRVAPRPGEFWRMNFSRVQWTVEKEKVYRKVTDENGKWLPEDNWVWAPTGLIDIHCPEFWGFVFFTENGEAYEVPGDEKRKLDLRRLYYAEYAFRRENGSFTSDLNALACSMPSYPVICEATSRTFLLSCASEQDNCSVYLRDDGYTFTEERSSAEKNT